MILAPLPALTQRRMDRVGTLVVKRLEGSPAGRHDVYSVTFVPAGDDSGSRPYSCHGDATLLRALEDLLPAPEQRLTALELVRGEGEARLTGVIVAESLIVKYALDAARSPAPGRGQPGSEVKLCAVCQLSVAPHDRLITVSGDIVHYACRPSVADMVEPAARFVGGADGRAFCQTCLAGLLHINFDEVRKVFGQLRMRTGFRLGTGQCSVCRKFRVTLWWTGTERSAADPLRGEEGLSGA